MTLDDLLAEREIQHAIYRYGRSCDARDWAGLDEVFAENAEAEFGGEMQISGRAAIVELFRSNLSGCGPTQHLMGNPEIGIKGDGALSRTYVRAYHQGVGEKAHLTYEVIGEYHASWRKLAEGWRATHWRLAMACELGTRDVLGPQ